MVKLARSAVFVGFESLCRQNGLNPLTLLQACGIDPLVLRRPDLYVRYARVAQVLSLAAEQSGNFQFGLQLSQQRDYLVFGPFGMLLSQAESFPDLIRLAQRYVHLHAQGIVLTAIEKSKELEIRYAVVLNEAVDLRQLVELGMGVVFRAIRMLFAQSWTPKLVTLQASPPGAVPVYEAFFQAPVLFGQAYNAFHADSGILALQPSEQRAQLKTHLISRYGDENRPNLHDLITQCMFILRSILSTGEATLATVARLIDIHPRQLQMALQQQGTSFRQLLDQVRYEEAQQQLRYSSCSITELALNLGYADETAFSRAFRRWSGSAPREWRKQQVES